MKRELISVTLVVATVMLLIGCRTTRADGSTEMYELAAALTKLSLALESTVRYKAPPDDADDETLLALATEHDKSLREPFRDYKVRVLRADRHAVVLVCKEDGTIGLLEDAGCTPKLDVHLWKEEPPRPCAFTLAVSEACAPSDAPQDAR